MTRTALLFVFHSLLLVTLSAAATNTTTPPPATTPAPDAGAPNVVVLSFRIDGVAFVARCNVSGAFNMSACKFDTDHGLTVSPLGTTGTTQSLPDYYLAMVILTLLMTVVLVGLGVAGYMMMKKMQDGYERVIQNVQNQPQYAQQQSNIPVQPMDPTMYGQQQFPMPIPQQQFNPYVATSSRVGGRSRRVISVDLVKPCLPGDLLSVP